MSKLIGMGYRHPNVRHINRWCKLSITLTRDLSHSMARLKCQVLKSEIFLTVVDITVKNVVIVLIKSKQRLIAVYKINSRPTFVAIWPLICY